MRNVKNLQVLILCRKLWWYDEGTFTQHLNVWNFPERLIYFPSHDLQGNRAVTTSCDLFLILIAFLVSMGLWGNTT